MELARFDDDLTRRLLNHVGHEPRERSVADLTALQHAFLDHVPYENLDIHIGRATTIDPVESARRILRGRGGYCFHLNGAFASLLLSLGYQVTLARGKVTGRDDGELGNHMVVMVHLDGDTWLPEVGLGDGYRDPIPLRAGVIRQPPFQYELRRLDSGRWRFGHDRRATIEGIDFEPDPVPLTAFEPNHSFLSAAPASRFVRNLVVQQRRHDHTLILRGCVRIHTGAHGIAERHVVDQVEWWALIADEFGLNIDDIDGRERQGLWHRIRHEHDEWVAAGRR